jgi:O-antigen ligase
MLATFIAYISIISFVDIFPKVTTLINAWIGIHVYLAIVGIVKKGRGVGGFLGDENDFCMTLNMIIPFAFFMALAEKNIRRKFIYIALTGLFLLANIITFSRGGFIGLAAVAIFCLLKSPKKIISTIVIVLLALSVLQFAPDKYWSEMKSIQQEGASEGTGRERVYQWKVGWKMFLDNPVMGVGQGNYPFRFREYEIKSGFSKGLEGRSRAGRAAHSLYFTLLPELGVAGAIIFFLMLYAVYKDTRAIRKISKGDYPRFPFDKSKLFYLSLAMEASLIGYLVSGFFISVLYYPSFWILMGFVLALRKVVSKGYEDSLASN